MGGKGHDKEKDIDTGTGLTGTGMHTGVGGANETTTSTRQPSQLAVLLATVGNPPLDAEQARVAAMSLFDQFVLASDRAELFFGAQRSLFHPGDVPDPRHDALARLMRAVATSLRTRLEAHESFTGSRELLRGIPTLAAPYVEGALAGFDLRRGAPGVFSADLMLGARAGAGVDPLESPDAGIIRRFLALATRGLMVPRSNRSGGVVADLGAVTLALGLLDLVANPRSALRAARVRLAKSGRLAPDDSARVRDVGNALRELMTHAVSSATQAGAAGRDLVKENVLSNELFELAAVALARAVYDGLGPDDEHPLVVPGADESDELTIAPVSALQGDEPAGGPVLGLYHRIAFVRLPYARAGLPGEEASASAGAGALGPRRSLPPTPPRAAGALDEPAFAKAREALKGGGAVAAKTGAAVASVSATYDATLDAADPRHAWRRAGAAATAQALARATEGDAATHFAFVVGARAQGGGELLGALATALAQAPARWYVLAPRAKERSLGFELLGSPLANAAPAAPSFGSSTPTVTGLGAVSPGSGAGLAASLKMPAGAASGGGASAGAGGAAGPGPTLRRADLSRWLDGETARYVDWSLEPGACVVLNAALLEGPAGAATYESLFRLARDVADRLEPRAVLVLAGAPTYLHAAAGLAVLGHHPDAELGAAPLRPGGVWFVRADAPLAAKAAGAQRGADEALVQALAEAYAPAPALADLAARMALVPPEAKYRGRLLRMSALAAAGSAAVLPGGALYEARRAAERAAQDPWDGAATRRALLAGVATHTTARAAAAAGMGHELLACARHEVALLTAEWELGLAQGRAHPTRLADVARGLLVELVPMAHAKVTLLANEALAAQVGGAGREFLDLAAGVGAQLAPALNSFPAGGVYAPSDGRGAPVGFVFRGGGADLTALVDVSVGPLAPRAVPAPCIELQWRPAEGRDASLGSVGLLLAGLHDVVRRWNADAVARAVPRENRPGFVLAIDVQLDARLHPEGVRVTLPLREKNTAAELQRAVGELGVRLVAAVGGDGPAEWTAQLHDARAGSAPLPIGEALIAQECATRWARALRVLPRHFPVGVTPNARYAADVEIATASALGLPGAVLGERRIPLGTPEARALLAWLATAAPDVMPRVKELLASLPVHPAVQQGSDLDLVDRCLSVAWFLHTNFCQAAAGPLRWSPADLPGGAQVVPKLLDAGALRQWLARKVGRNPQVEQRVAAVEQALEPSVVVDG